MLSLCDAGGEKRVKGMSCCRTKLHMRFDRIGDVVRLVGRFVYADQEARKLDGKQNQAEERAKSSFNFKTYSMGNMGTATQLLFSMQNSKRAFCYMRRSLMKWQITNYFG